MTNAPTRKVAIKSTTTTINNPPSLANKPIHQKGGRLSICAAITSEAPSQRIWSRVSLPNVFLEELAALPKAYLPHTDPIRQSGFGRGTP
jgi:hypothetical protein